MWVSLIRFKPRTKGAVKESRRVVVGGPYFEDLERGQVFDAPGLTLTWGHAAIHQAICGDRMLLPLDAGLCREVTGSENALIHPNLVCDVAIGQSTEPTQRVLGNLFYRGLVLMRPVFRGETLRTQTEIVALKQNRPRDDGSASGLAVLRIQTRNQNEDAVLDFYRCPMIPMRDAAIATGHADDFGEFSKELDPERVRAALPDWDWAALRSWVADPASLIEAGTVFEVEGRESVTTSPELARLTLNLAMTHRDPGAGRHGRRLVYGGQTISIAVAHVTRAIPALATIIAWKSCDHSAPVFEGDVLSTEIEVLAVTEIEGGASLADLRAVVHADRGNSEAPEQVLDWVFVGVLA